MVIYSPSASFCISDEHGRRVHRPLIDNDSGGTMKLRKIERRGEDGCEEVGCDWTVSVLAY